MYAEIFARSNFAICFNCQKFFITQILSCVNDYIEDIYGDLHCISEIYSIEYFCNIKIAGLGENFV